MVPHLLQNKCIIDDDRERIFAASNQKGAKAAAFVLFMSIPRRKKDWFARFMHALKESHHDDLIEKIEPEFGKIG